MLTSRARALSTCLLFLVLLMTTSSAQTPRFITVTPGGALPFSDAVVAGGFIYTAGVLGADAEGRLAGHDVRAQATRALERLDTILRRAGSGLPNAVSVMVYLRNRSDFAAMNEVYRGVWPDNAPARTTVIAPLASADALVEIAVVAVPAGTERVAIRPEGWIPSPNPYNYAIRTGDTLFLSGLISRNGRDNSVVPGDAAAQTTTVLENAKAILQSAGMTFADVVSARVFLTDQASFDAMNRVYRSYFPEPRPARATVIAAMTAPDYLVEITLVAVKGGDRRVVAATNADGSPSAPNANLSNAVKVGSRLFVSGVLGNTAANAGDVPAQTRAALASIGRTLEAAGFTWRDVVEGIVYLPDLAQFASMNTAYATPFQATFPARTTIGAGLVSAGGAVEIMVTAIK